jgi:orotate phosphoribosyltransferase
MNKNDSFEQKFLKFSLEIGAIELLRQGRVLKSGRISPYFFNSGLFNSGSTIKVLADAYANKILKMDLKPDYIFGPAYKGITLSATVAEKYFDLTGVDVKFVFDRKEEKDHGEKGIVVGLPPRKNTFEGKKVVIVDDVMTSGKSCIKASELISKLDGIPIACVVCFDRQEKAIDSNITATQNFINKTGIPVYSVLNLSLLKNNLKQHAFTALEWEIFEKIIAYEEKHC